MSLQRSDYRENVANILVEGTKELVMKSQDSMFEAPGCRSSNSQERTMNFHEQRQERKSSQAERNEEYRGYEEDAGIQQIEGEKVFPRGRLKPWGRGAARPLLIPLLILVLALGGNSLAVGLFNRGASVLPSQTFTVNALPTLMIDNGKGDVQIHTGNANSITVIAKQHADGISTLDPNNVQVNYTRSDNNTIVVSSKGEASSFVGDMRVDLDITVPYKSNLQVQTDSGAVEIVGVQGQITLQTVGGDVTANNIDGQMTISTNSGDMALNGAMLRGQTQLKSQSGSISIQGAIDPQGEYQMETSQGDIDLSLSDNSSFYLNVTHGSGDIDNEFEGNPVGSGPYAKLIVSTGSGDITLKKDS